MWKETGNTRASDVGTTIFLLRALSGPLMQIHSQKPLFLFHLTLLIEVFEGTYIGETS